MSISKRIPVRIKSASCSNCAEPFCAGYLGCPANKLIGSAISAYQKGNLLEALWFYRQVPLGSITGWVCPAFCQGSNLNQNDGCVKLHNNRNSNLNIKGIERDIFEQAWQKKLIKPLLPQKKNNFSVAIIGAGPAGLSIAQKLAQWGCEVSIFSREVGGLLKYGILKEHLPNKVLERELKFVFSHKIKFINKILGKNIYLEDLKKKFKVVVLAIGFEKPRPLTDQKGNLIKIKSAKVIEGIEYLKYKRTNKAKTISVQNKKIIVIGGGATAWDSLLTARIERAKYRLQLIRGDKDYYLGKLLYNCPYFNGNEAQLYDKREYEAVTQEIIQKKDDLEISYLQKKTGKIIKQKVDLVIKSLGFLGPKLIEAGLDKKLIKIEKNGSIKPLLENEFSSKIKGLKNVYYLKDQGTVVGTVGKAMKTAQEIINDFKVPIYK